MEKLQKALQKAREVRGEAVPPPSRPAVSSRSPAERRGEAWAGLETFEPDQDLLVRNRIFTFAARQEGRPFDILRTKIFLTMRQNGWKRLAITSPDKGCGKSTIACNLAFGLSRQSQTRTILLDLDMRRPGLAGLLGCRPPHDMPELLKGEVSPEEQMLLVNGNLALALSSRSLADPSDVLLAAQAGQVLDAMQARFSPDVMILDLGPMLQTDDARTALKYADCALIVARAEQTRVSGLDSCEQEVGQHTNVLGVVLNGCRHVTAEEEDYYQATE